jgi:hypothetical protein
MDRSNSQIILPSGVQWAQFGATTNPHVHVDQVLSNIVQGYRPEDRVWDRVAPVVSVGKQSDFYLVHNRADMLRRESAIRAPGTEARLVTRSIGSGTYFALNYALKMGVTIEDRANADPMYLQEFIEGHATFLVDILDLDIESRVAVMATTVANVGSGAGVASAWNTDDGDPIGDINAAIDVVQDSTGKPPNRISLGKNAWKSLRRHVDVRNIIFGANNGGGFPSIAQVAALFEMDEIIVGGTYENTANEAQAEDLAPIWADHVTVFRAAPDGAGQRDVSAFRSFRWSAPGLANMQVERHPFDTKTKSEEMEVGFYQDEKVTGGQYAYVIRAVNSST